MPAPVIDVKEVTPLLQSRTRARDSSRACRGEHADIRGEIVSLVGPSGVGNPRYYG